MNKRPLMTLRLLADRLGIQPINCADGTRLSPIAGGIEIATPETGTVTVTVRYGWFGPEPTPANTEQAGGYFVPTEVAEAMRDESVMVSQRRAAPLIPELSGWIDGSVKPTIVGVYERDFPHSISCPQPNYSLWDGVSWHEERNDVRNALFRRPLSVCQNAAWRGLRHDPARSEGHAS